MTGLIYWHPWFYRTLLRILYGSQFRKRYLNISMYIKPGWSVLDICCGDCYLYKFLRDRNHYLGIDSNKRFTTWAKRSGIQTMNFDIRYCDWPMADCVVIQGSLYQFIPNQKEILKKGLNAARKRLIVSEPVHNLSQYSLWLSRLSRLMVNPGLKFWSNERFTSDSLTSVYQDSGCTNIFDNERELMGIFDLE